MLKLLSKILLAGLLTLPFSFFSQSTKVDDRELILAKCTDDVKYNTDKKVSYMFKDSQRAIIKFNPVSLTLGGLMFVYQRVISQQLLSECPYSLSCSHFSVNVIKMYGIKGLFLSADRLTRCNSIAAKDVRSVDIDNSGKIKDSPDRYCSKRKK